MGSARIGVRIHTYIHTPLPIPALRPRFGRWGVHKCLRVPSARPELGKHHLDRPLWNQIQNNSHDRSCPRMSRCLAIHRNGRYFKIGIFQNQERLYMN